MTQAKIIFDSDEGSETVWATPFGDGFVVDNYPFYLKGVNFGDVVEATPISPGVYEYVRTITRSPNSLYRVLFEEAQSARATGLLASLRGLGCGFERGTMDGAVLLAVHIPEAVDANAAWKILETGLDDGTWQLAPIPSPERPAATHRPVRAGRKR